MIEMIQIQPTYRRDNGLWVLDIDKAIKPIDFSVFEKSIVYVPAGEYGGNHRHPRKEALVCAAGDLWLTWEDVDGRKCEEQMRGDKDLALFVISSMTPHAVTNRGTEPGILLEYADGPQVGVVAADLLSSRERNVN